MKKFKAFSILLFVFLFFLDLSLFKTFKNNSSVNKPSAYPEIEQVANLGSNFKVLKIFFKELAERKGAKYAYQVLKQAPIPPGIDIHLMGHIIGVILYKQQGAKGIEVCTPDFRNACSHTIVVGLLLDKGETALSEIAAACKQAPGGSGAYTMCYHGLGHGVLAYSGFDVKKAIKLCGKTSSKGFEGSEAVECVGGMIMEIISGGDHDKTTWQEQRKIYLKNSDPLYPCNSDFMPDSARPSCYVYLTPHFFEVAGANLGNPDPEHFKKAFPYCNKIDKTDYKNFDSCYGGFGKEFVVLGAGHDIRTSTLTTAPKEQLKEVYEWCKLADLQDGAAACIIHAVNSYYWGGENPYSISVNFCSVIDDNYLRKSCFINLIRSAFSFKKDSSYLNSFCSSLPSDFQTECQKNLK